MVLTMSTFPGALSPLGSSLREPLSVAQFFAFALWGTWFPLVTAIRFPVATSIFSTGPVSLPRAAKSVPRTGHGGAGSCWLHKGKKSLFEIKIKQLQNFTFCWQVNCHSTLVGLEHVKSICVRCGQVVCSVGRDPKKVRRLYYTVSVEETASHMV